MYSKDFAKVTNITVSLILGFFHFALVSLFFIFRLYFSGDGLRNNYILVDKKISVMEEEDFYIWGRYREADTLVLLQYTHILNSLKKKKHPTRSQINYYDSTKS